MAAKGGKGGSAGQASNAALQDDEDQIMRRRAAFGKWKQTRVEGKKPVHPGHMINYTNSPKPPGK